MKRDRVLAAFAAVALAACGGGDGGAAEGDLVDTAQMTPPPVEAPPAPSGTADTAGVGIDPPTAGGQVVDSAAVPGPVDTAQGTPTAP